MDSSNVISFEISDLNDEIINDIYSIALVYNLLFVDKYRLYTFVTPKREELILDIQKEQFMHLCGFSYYIKKNNSASFFEDCLSKKLSGTVHTSNYDLIIVKLKALQNIIVLVEAKTARICKSSTFIQLSVDKALRSSKELLALGLVNNDSIGCLSQKKSIKHYSSNTTLNLKHGDKSFAKDLKESYKVVKIMTFNKITHELIEVSDNSTEKKKKKAKKAK